VDRVTKGKVRVDAIATPSSFAFLGDIAFSQEVGDYFTRSPLGDADGHCQVQGCSAGVTGDIAKYHGMVGEESPLGHLLPPLCRNRSTKVLTSPPKDVS